MRKINHLLAWMLFVPFLGSIVTGQKLTVNPAIFYHDMEGFGTFNTMDFWKGQTRSYIYDKYCNDLGSSIMRIEVAPGFQTSENGSYNINAATFGGPTIKQNWDDINAMKSMGLEKVIATVWTPPSYMKYVETGHCPDELWTRLSNGIGPKSNKVDGLIGDPGAKKDMYPLFADYLVKYCQDFKAYTGMDLYAVGLQNEPLYCHDFNSSILEGKQFRDLVNEVGAKFKEKGVKTKIMGSEHMGGYSTELQYFEPMLMNEEHNCREHLGFFAVHGYLDGFSANYGDAAGWSGMYDVCEKYGKQLWMTETSGYAGTWLDGPDSDGKIIGGGFEVAKSMFIALKHGKISGWTWWGLADDYANSQYSLVDLGTPDYSYYASKQFFKYIRPGAKMIDASCDDNDVLTLGFIHGDESRLTLILINNSTSSKTVNLDVPNYSTPNYKAMRTSGTEKAVMLANVTSNNVTLPAQSITTLVAEGTNKAPTIDKPADIIILSSAGKQDINLTNVTDGDNKGQTLTLSATSSDATIIPTPSIAPVSGSNYKLSFTPVNPAKGEVTLQVKVVDNGSNDLFNSSYTKFKVKVIPFVNKAPNIDAIPTYYIKKGDVTKKTILLNGLNDGNDGSQVISFTTETSNTTVVRTLKAVYVPGGGSNVSFYGLNANGEVTVTLNIKDDGGADLGGVDTKTITFKIIVSDTYTSEGELTEALVNIYPNPADNLINVELTDDSYSQIEIINTTGVIVYSTEIKSALTSIDASEIISGVYFVIVKGNQNVIKKKLVVK